MVELFLVAVFLGGGVILVAVDVFAGGVIMGGEDVFGGRVILGDGLI